jgi:hypothetical protein
MDFYGTLQTGVDPQLVKSHLQLFYVALYTAALYVAGFGVLLVLNVPRYGLWMWMIVGWSLVASYRISRFREVTQSVHKAAHTD